MPEDLDDFTELDDSSDHAGYLVDADVPDSDGCALANDVTARVDGMLAADAAATALTARPMESRSL